MRLAVYCDYSYRRDAVGVYAELPFALFVLGLAPHSDRLVLTGRLDPSPGRYPYVIIHEVEFLPLPHYASGAHFSAVLRTMPAGIRCFWRLLDDIDVVWVLGPNPPQALAFALLTKLRSRRLVLGVRQHLPQLIRHRYPTKRVLPWTATMLEGAFRVLARTAPVVAVGPELARRYRSARAVHTTYVSMLSAHDILAREDDDRVYDGAELRMLSVGRLDPEKNPLLLADILQRALRLEPRWRLDVCGDGSLIRSLAERLQQLGIADRARLHGYVPIDGGLWDLYRASHALLHVSFTEGVPQVLLEAFATRLPVVATAVGGVADLASGCSLLVPPDDADAAADALAALATDARLRAELVDRAVIQAREHTITAECASLAAFLAGQ